RWWGRLSAAHSKYSVERALKAPDSPFSEYLADIDGAADVVAGKAAGCAGITAPSDRRLVLQLARRKPALLHRLPSRGSRRRASLAAPALRSAPPRRAASAPGPGARRAGRPDATGPFELAS